eukprot:m51a1_g2812 AMP deaminase, putative (1204) ;mRNA; f:134940-140480
MMHGRLRREGSFLPAGSKEPPKLSFPRIDAEFEWDRSDESKKAAGLLHEALMLRHRYMAALTCMPRPLPVPTPDEFIRDHDRVASLCEPGPTASLDVLGQKYTFHKLLNHKKELAMMRESPYCSRPPTRVDTHIHLAAAMTEKHLLDFIQRKWKSCPDEVVMVKAGNPMTLSQVMESLHINPEHMTVHSLNVRAGHNTFYRFDVFNDRYNPFGQSDLRTIFMKTNNHIKGKYFAELTKEVFEVAEAFDKKTELRLSIYGRSASEWDELAAWVANFNVRSPNNRWLIQVPRIFPSLIASKSVSSFQQFLDNVFNPLVAASEDPASNPTLCKLLEDISGFDSVDDESKADFETEGPMPEPALWTQEENPPYYYYMYWMYQRICSLNQLRNSKGLSLFDFRPHSGESGNPMHLVATFLTASGVNHGINLSEIPSIQYLFFLLRIGICVSPLSNNSLFLNYSENPFKLFFQRGLNVSLSTDDPLQFHYTQSPLTEEYAIASRFWSLTTVDLAEIAANSVKHSGFSDGDKAKWLGPDYQLMGQEGNDPALSNVPQIRAQFRQETYDAEVQLMKQLLTSSGRNALRSSWEEKSSQYCAITIYGLLLDENDRTNAETLAALPLISEALAMRDKYFAATRPVQGSRHAFTMKEGCFVVFESPEVLCANDLSEIATIYCPTCAKHFCALCFNVLHRSPALSSHVGTPHDEGKPLYDSVPFEEFVDDYRKLVSICSNGPVRTLCWYRNHLLQERFNFHVLVNERSEDRAVVTSGTDMYRVTKVDTHIHFNRAMTSVQLLNFMKKEISSDRFRFTWKSFMGEGTTSLKEVFAKLGIDRSTLNLDNLNVTAGADTYMRYDTWLAKYCPFGKPQLRELLLKWDNMCGGYFLAKQIKEIIFDATVRSPSLKIELRVSWIAKNELNTPGNMWLIQVPRVYSVAFKSRTVKTFEEFLRNLFWPLFDATMHPEQHPELTDFMKHIGGFDMVGDEASYEPSFNTKVLPHEWSMPDDPPYAYWFYYLYSNIRSLNLFRSEKGLNTFQFRPHCGESGDVFHLAAAFLTAHHINGGNTLKDNPALSYLYYLKQMGVSMCPLSYSSVLLQYRDSPFPILFKRGLNICLGTDSPLHTHMTDEPLVEEYAMAAETWKLSTADLCEVSRNSVLQSSFSDQEKLEWLGPDYLVPEKQQTSKTNVPKARLLFRNDSLLDEIAFLHQQQHI